MSYLRKKLGPLLYLPTFLHDLEHRQESRLNTMVELFRAMREPLDPSATLLVIGETRQNDGDPFPTALAASKRVAAGRSSTMVEIEVTAPLESCTAVVLCDLERVEVNGLFVGTNVVNLGSPVGMFDSVAPGYRVRAMLNQREPSGK